MTERSALPISTQVAEARNFLIARIGAPPEVGLILGSGLAAGSLALEDPIEVPVGEIPHLPVPSVVGHQGVWTFGRISGRPVVVAGGRVHRYEGIPLDQVTLGVRVIRALGARALVVTNAAGGIRADLTPGTLMRIRDHLNLLGDSPLVGSHEDSLGARFVDLSEAYDRLWGDLACGSLSREGIELPLGVYAACLGPQYETPAEIDHLEKIGADAVGMSTVPEVIVARQVGLAVFGLSLISNAAAGRGAGTLSHEEVLEAGRRAMGQLSRVVEVLVDSAP